MPATQRLSQEGMVMLRRIEDRRRSPIAGALAAAVLTALTGSSQLAQGQEVDRPRAVASFEGTAAPGLRITLKADGSTSPGLHYRWLQTRGPAVTLDDPSGQVAHLIVP